MIYGLSTERAASAAESLIRTDNSMSLSAIGAKIEDGLGKTLSVLNQKSKLISILTLPIYMTVVF